MLPKSTNILVDRTEARVTITMNREATSNALAPEMVEDLISIFENLGPCDLVVLKGAGKTFCAGFDLSDLDALRDGDILLRILRIEALLQAVHHAPVPVVACAQGHAIGAGADLFAACWQRVAAPGTKFKFPGWNFELALGTRRLTHLLGSDTARDILMDTRSVGAAQAVDIGLATASVETDALKTYLDVLEQRCKALPAFSKTEMLALTTHDTRVADIASIVATAGRPGLKGRIKAYQTRVAKARAERRLESTNG